MSRPENLRRPESASVHLEIDKNYNEILKQLDFEVEGSKSNKFKEVILTYYKTINPLITKQRVEDLKNSSNPETYSKLYQNLAINFLNQKFKSLNKSISPILEKSRVINKKQMVNDEDIVLLGAHLKTLGESLKNSKGNKDYIKVLQNTLDSKLSIQDKQKNLENIFAYIRTSPADKLYSLTGEKSAESLQAQTLIESLSQPEVEVIMKKLLSSNDSESLQKFQQIAIYSDFPTPIAFRLLRNAPQTQEIKLIKQGIDNLTNSHQSKKQKFIDSKNSQINKLTAKKEIFQNSYVKNLSKNKFFLGGAYIWGVLTTAINALIIASTGLDKKANKTIASASLLAGLGGVTAYMAGQAIAGKGDFLDIANDTFQKLTQIFGYSKQDLDNLKQVQLNRLASKVINKSDSKKSLLFANNTFLEVIAENDLSKIDLKNSNFEMSNFIQKIKNKDPKIATYFQNHYLKKGTKYQISNNEALLELYTIQKSFSHKKNGLAIQNRDQFIKNYATPNRMKEDDFPEIS